MNQSLINKSTLALAITASLYGVNAVAAVPDTINITNMVFSSTTYVAEGTLKRANGGIMNSVDPFFGKPWTGTQQTAFMTNSDTFANCDGINTDPLNDDGGCAVGVVKSTGPVSGQGNYDFDSALAGMTADQVAVGVFFDWNMNNGIALLGIFDCDASGDCKGNGVPMANGPFTGSLAIFSGGPSPLACTDLSALTDVNAQVQVPVSDVTATCVDEVGAVTVASFDSTTVNGGVVTNDGTDFTYTPLDGFEGPDTFTVSLTDSRPGAATIVMTVSIQVGGELQSNFTMLGNDGSQMGGSNDVEIVWDEVTYNSNATDPTTVDIAGPLADFGVPTDNIGVMTINSPQPFFGFNWFANNVRVFKGPAKLKFDVSCTLADYEAGITDCRTNPMPPLTTGDRYVTLELADGEIGAHMVFDWGSKDPTTACGVANCDIDVVNKWAVDVPWSDPDGTGPSNNLWVGAAGVPPANDQTAGGPANWRLTSIDIDDPQDLANEIKDKDGNNIHVNGKPMIDGAFIGSNANFNYKPDKAGKAALPYAGTIDDISAPAFSIGLWSMLAGLFSIVGLRKLKK